VDFVIKKGIDARSVVASTSISGLEASGGMGRYWMRACVKRRVVQITTR
jgi:hypothetical protein